MKVIVCQHGARRRYAVPRILEQAGVLEALYTDSCGCSLLGTVARVVRPFSTGRLSRLANRTIQGIPKDKIYTSDRYTLTLQQIVKARRSSMIERFQAMNESLVPALRRWGIRGADVFYSMHGEDIQYLMQIQGKIKIVVDVCANPLAQRIFLAEYSKHTHIDVDLDEYRQYTKFREEHFVATAALADILLCPSRWTANGVTRLCPKDACKIRICPYGSSIDYSGRVNRPVNGKIFWAGCDWVGKGLHYLAQAADKLKQQYPNIDLRVAGITNPKVIKMPRFKNSNFLGKLNKEQMQEEFMTADMFVFPTLSEGMAGVVIEALAAGCPIITTECAGIDGMVSGHNGILVDLDVDDSLYRAIIDLYRNRDKRDFIAHNSQKLAASFTEKAWRARLLETIQNG